MKAYVAGFVSALLAVTFTATRGRRCAVDSLADDLAVFNGDRFQAEVDAYLAHPSHRGGGG